MFPFALLHAGVLVRAVCLFILREQSDPEHHTPKSFHAETC